MLISEYTGGGFGSKIPGAQSMAIPALMSKKLNGRPVMMRISREEETYIGRTRPGYQGWIKMGFKKDGRVTAIDTFIVEASGPYRRQGDHATAANLASLLYPGAEHALPRHLGGDQHAAGRLAARAGRPAGVGVFEPLVARGREEARHRSGRDSQDQRARRPGALRPRAAEHAAGTSAQQADQLLRQGGLDQGAELFNWEERKKQQRQAHAAARCAASAVGTGAYTAGSIGVDGLCVIRPDGKLDIHQGIGNLGTHSVIDTARVIAEVVDVPWENCEVVWGNTVEGPAVELDPGRQPDDLRAHPRQLRDGPWTSRRSCRSLRRKTKGGSPDGYDIGAQGVIRKGGGLAMTWAQAAEARDQARWQVRRHTRCRRKSTR